MWNAAGGWEILGNWQCHLQEFGCSEFLLQYCLGNKKRGWREEKQRRRGQPGSWAQAERGSFLNFLPRTSSSSWWKQNLLPKCDRALSDLSFPPSWELPTLQAGAEREFFEKFAEKLSPGITFWFIYLFWKNSCGPGCRFTAGMAHRVTGGKICNNGFYKK